MINLDNLNRQHDTIKAEIDFIEAEIKKETSSINSAAAALHISKLAGQLRVHLMEEDKFLYPNLLKNPDAQIRNLTEKYIKEMGDLADKYTEFKNSYNMGSKINDKITVFAEDAKEMIALLKERMLKEDQELYRLVKEKNL